jgi:hypothetical protein
MSANQCMGCQSGWPFKWHAEGAPAYHVVVGGYPGERVACTKNLYDIPTPGHCSLGTSRPRPDGGAAYAPAIPAGVYAALDPACEGKDQTVLFMFVSEKDFELMLEVDMAFIDWLRRRNIL